jgi:transketolase
VADYRALPRRLTGDEKHAPSAHSTLDVLWVLYDRVLNVTPETVADPARDRFLLSKGHGPAAYYAGQGVLPGLRPPRRTTRGGTGWTRPASGAHCPSSSRWPFSQMGRRSICRKKGIAPVPQRYERADAPARYV